MRTDCVRDLYSLYRRKASPSRRSSSLILRWVDGWSHQETYRRLSWSATESLEVGNYMNILCTLLFCHFVFAAFLDHSVSTNNIDPQINQTKSVSAHYLSGGGCGAVVLKARSLQSKRSDVRTRVSLLRFQRLGVSCFPSLNMTEMLLKQCKSSKQPNPTITSVNEQCMHNKNYNLDDIVVT